MNLYVTSMCLSGWTNIDGQEWIIQAESMEAAKVAIDKRLAQQKVDGESDLKNRFADAFLPKGIYSDSYIVSEKQKYQEALNELNEIYKQSTYELYNNLVLFEGDVVIVSTAE